MSENNISALSEAPARHWLRNWIALALILVVLSSCSRDAGPQITIVWRKPKPQLQQKTPLKYMSIQIGHVTAIAPDEAGGTAVSAKLRMKYAHYVRAKSAFLVSSNAAEPVFIEVRPLSEDSPPVENGAIFRGAESELEAAGQKLVADWRKTSIWLGIALLALLLVVLATKFAFRAFGMILCFAGGAVAAAYIATPINIAIQPHSPPGIRIDLVAYVIAFLVGYVGVSLILGISKRLRRGGTH